MGVEMNKCVVMAEISKDRLEKLTIRTAPYGKDIPVASTSA
jgi:hypothetical protein